MTVSASHEQGRAFTAACGDGKLTTNALANVDNWPGALSTWSETLLIRGKKGKMVQSSTAGIGFRGGPWSGDPKKDGTLHISCRYLAACRRDRRHSTYAWRAVRQAP